MTIRVVTPAGGAPSITITWDNSVLTVPAGVVVDIPPGSSMEAAYGLANLTPLAATALADDLEGTGGLATDGG